MDSSQETPGFLLPPLDSPKDSGTLWDFDMLFLLAVAKAPAKFWALSLSLSLSLYFSLSLFLSLSLSLSRLFLLACGGVGGWGVVGRGARARGACRCYQARLLAPHLPPTPHHLLPDMGRLLSCFFFFLSLSLSISVSFSLFGGPFFGDGFWDWSP